jgi:hypothetical protein
MPELVFPCDKDQRIYKFQLPIASGTTAAVDLPRNSVVVSVALEEHIHRLLDSRQSKLMLYVMAPVYYDYAECECRHFRLVSTGELIFAGDGALKFIGTVTNNGVTRHVFEVIK